MLNISTNHSSLPLSFSLPPLSSFLELTFTAAHCLLRICTQYNTTKQSILVSLLKQRKDRHMNKVNLIDELAKMSERLFSTYPPPISILLPIPQWMGILLKIHPSDSSCHLTVIYSASEKLLRCTSLAKYSRAPPEWKCSFSRAPLSLV